MTDDCKTDDCATDDCTTDDCETDDCRTDDCKTDDCKTDDCESWLVWSALGSLSLVLSEYVLVGVPVEVPVRLVPPPVNGDPGPAILVVVALLCVLRGLDVGNVSALLPPTVVDEEPTGPPLPPLPPFPSSEVDPRFVTT